MIDNVHSHSMTIKRSVDEVYAHRYPAFDACRWILDTIKADIPVWKQEYYEDDSSKWLSNNG